MGSGLFEVGDIRGTMVSNLHDQFFGYVFGSVVGFVFSGLQIVAETRHF